MSTPEVSLHEKKVQTYIESIRPPLEIRKELDLSCTYDGRNFYLEEVRPDWSNPAIKRRYPFAKFTFLKSRRTWKLYWLRASGKWEHYDLLEETANLDTVLKTIEKDASGCFFG